MKQNAGNAEIDKKMQKQNLQKMQKLKNRRT